MAQEYFYFFRNSKLGAIYKTQASDSDAALLKCLAETRWPVYRIVYEGKDSFPLSIRFYREEELVP